jgi:ComF family protein
MIGDMGDLAEKADVWQSVGSLARVFRRRALDALLPPQCLTCDAAVAEDGLFCATCFVGAGFITAPFCRACGLPAAHAGQLARTGVCDTCVAAPPPWSQARAALRYDGQGKSLVLRLKRADRLELVRPLARMMARSGADLLREAEVIVPVPLHRRRLLARRFNQSALLAGAVGALAGRRVLPDALRRVRPTVSLGHLGREERRRVLEGAFAVRAARAAALAGRRVLLIDDVMTSGATAAACSEVLLRSGVARVDLLVAARVAAAG